MRLMDNRTGSIAALAALISAFSVSPVFAGVDRWTTSGPADGGVVCLAIDPTNPDILYAGSDLGVFKSSNGGLSWSNWSNGQLSGVRSLAVDPTSPSHLLAGTASGFFISRGVVFESNDGGANWSARLAASAIYNIVFGSEHTVYAADYDTSYYPRPSTLQKSSDDGKTWGLEFPGFRIARSTLVVDPTQPSTLYAGGDLFNSFSVGGSVGIRKSVDGGAHWASPSGDFGTSSIQALLIDPQSPATLYAGTNQGIYKSVDAGGNWHLTSEDTASFDVSCLAIDPIHPATLYAGTYDRGVFRSTDAGASWSSFSNGLTSLAINSLKIDRTGTRLHIAAAGLVYDYQIFSGAVDLTVSSGNRLNLLLTDADGHLSLRTIDSSGESITGPSNGPFRDWFPIAVADDSSGLAHVLWNKVNGAAAVWLVGPGGRQAGYLLPLTPGWTAVDVSAGSEGLTHLLWTNADGRTAIGTIDSSGQPSYTPAFGPFPGWTAVAIADGPDGQTRLLWNKVDGSAGLSLVGPGGLLSSYRYAPATGWTATDVAVGPGDQARILWTNLDGGIAVWGVDPAGVSTQGPAYSAPAGFRARRIAAGADGVARVLWTGADGSGLVWLMSADNLYQETLALGPN